MQQLILEHNRTVFKDSVNEHLMNGWRVVPGTLNVGSTKIVPFANSPKHFIGPDGYCVERHYSIVLENDEK